MLLFVLDEGLGVTVLESTNKLQRDHLAALKAGGLISDNPVGMEANFEGRPQNLSWRPTEDIPLQHSKSNCVTWHQIQYILEEWWSINCVCTVVLLTARLFPLCFALVTSCRLATGVCKQICLSLILTCSASVFLQRNRIQWQFRLVYVQSDLLVCVILAITNETRILWVWWQMT
jgi:hypothetical protein